MDILRSSNTKSSNISKKGIYTYELLFYVIEETKVEELINLILERWHRYSLLSL